jgi:hypothetical protein
MFNWIKNLFLKNKTEEVEQNVFSVDTGDMPPEVAAKVITEIKEEKTKPAANKRRGRPKKTD